METAPVVICATTFDPDKPGEDEPGDDCPDHGPYADDECPKCKAEREEADKERASSRAEANALLYAPPLLYQPARLAQAHTDGTLIVLLCHLDRIKLEAHAQAFAAWLCDEVAVGQGRPASYAKLPEYRALLLRRWRSMLATRTIEPPYFALAG